MCDTHALSTDAEMSSTVSVFAVLSEEGGSLSQEAWVPMTEVRAELCGEPVRGQLTLQQDEPPRSLSHCLSVAALTERWAGARLVIETGTRPTEVTSGLQAPLPWMCARSENRIFMALLLNKSFNLQHISNDFILFCLYCCSPSVNFPATSPMNSFRSHTEVQREGRKGGPGARGGAEGVRHPEPDEVLRRMRPR